MDISTPKAAQQLFEKGQYSQVIDLINSPDSAADSGPASQFVLLSYFKLGNFLQCLDCPITSESIYQDDSSYLSMRAACLRRLGDLAKSQSVFLKAISIDPASIEIKNNYANLLIDLGKYTEASELLDEIINTKPDYSDALINKKRLTVLQSKVPNTTDSISGALSYLSDPLSLHSIKLKLII